MAVSQFNTDSTAPTQKIYMERKGSDYMAIYGYTRISTNSNKQDNTRQINGIMNYLKSRGINSGIKFFNDEITGKTFDRPELDKLMNEVSVGDEVIIYQLDRLGRRKEGIKEALETFKRRGVVVRVLDIPTTLQDFSKMDSGLAKTVMELINDLMIEIAGAFAEAEAERISSRVKEGMAVAKAKGKQIGNSQKTKESLPQGFEYYYELIQNKTLKKKDVAGILGVSDATLWRYCKLYEGSDVYKKNAENVRTKRKSEEKKESNPEWIVPAVTKLTRKIKRDLGINILDKNCGASNINRTITDISIEYVFEYEGKTYMFEYLRNLDKIEVSILQK